MRDSIVKNEHAGYFSKRQQFFARYTFFVLVDLECQQQIELPQATLTMKVHVSIH